MSRPVELSSHAVDRMFERFPDVAGKRTTMRQEVADAIDAGRRSKRKPDWAKNTENNAGRKNIRFAWTEDLSRCYVISDVRHTSGIVTLVVSVLGPGDPVKVERHGLVGSDSRQTQTGKHAPRRMSRRLP